MDVELVLEAHATMGESPTWAPIERALYWIHRRPGLDQGAIDREMVLSIRACAMKLSLASRRRPLR